MLCHITYEEQLTMYCKIFDVTKGRTEIFLLCWNKLTRTQVHCVPAPD